MNRRTLLIVVGAIGLLAIVAVGWYLASPLFIDDAVDEAFPFEAPAEDQIAGMSEEERKALESDFMTAGPEAEEVAALSTQDKEAVTDKVMDAAATVMMDKPMDEAMTPAANEWTMVAAGQFVGADNFHLGSGSAGIYQQGDQRVLRFEEFSVTNGSDLHVILTKHPAPSGPSEVGEDYVDLGPLKGNLGNQNYEIPAGVDLSEYQGVVIYCVPFHVVFATATLG